MRKVILHYHLYKNAGSSIDSILQNSLGEQWANYDLNQKGVKIYPDGIKQFIDANPQLRAISSHQAVPPLPQGDFKVFPIIFLRHPILRIRSAYVFEWQKQLGLDKPKGSFSEYIDAKLRKNHLGGLSNFHVSRLSNISYEESFIASQVNVTSKLETAKLFLSNIPFFGLVEEFQASLIRLHYYLKMTFPEITVKHYETNVLQNLAYTTEERIRFIREEVGEKRYINLALSNELDIELYEYATGLFKDIVPR
jgi:hypothetical protein